ncbi:class I adenylate cyclase [Salinispirillum sp. LH 10-3-1]|uniref:Class I adenylate cyclase n=1 Tax=Salinispirillum sp. LH 10-3-1 TaxID=2952525 RepID=A0AB38YG55_9GAMM
MNESSASSDEQPVANPDFTRLDAATVHAARERFAAIQQGRMERVRQVLQPQQQTCLSMLPLLLHLNSSLLPGFISMDVPAGVLGYTPSENTLKVTEQFARQFRFSSSMVDREREIVSVFLMGSPGSVAHNVRSDLDIWICHRPAMNPERLARLVEKTQVLERWAKGFNLEVHFFLMDAARFSGGERETLTGEYCGSTQHYLLLDEFYRTGVHLAGAIPVWWFVPPELENDYDNTVRRLFDNALLRRDEVVDFGKIDRMPQEEYVGAAMWQLYKGIDSPWKSLLKLLLLEAYAHEPKQNPSMLCHNFKQLIYDNQLDLNDLDPYVMMYRRIERLLCQKEQKQRLELLRKCLYLKSGVALSKPLNKGRANWRRALMEKLTLEWAWSGSDLAVLDDRDSWGIQRALEARNEIMREFTQSYRNLTRFAQQHGGQSIMSRGDMRVLGRKLHTTFERKPGKIDILNEQIAPNLSQEKVTLHQLPSRERGTYLWAAYVDLLMTDLKKYPPPLKHARGFMEVLLWSHLNGLLTGHLHVPVYTQRSNLSDFEVKELMSSLKQWLPFPLPAPPATTFQEPSRTQKVMVYVNVGVDPMAKLSKRGLQKISSRIDSLDYSALGENLVRTLDVVTVSTWHEVVCTRYDSADSLIQFLQAFFSQLYRQSDTLPEIDVQSFCASRAAATMKRVKELLQDMIRVFFQSENSEHTRYLIRIEQTFYLCQFHQGRFYAQPAPTVRHLYPLLAQEQTEFSPLVLDANAMLRHSGLKLILESAKPGQIVVCYQSEKSHLSYWILDENATLFQARVVNNGVSNLLNHLYRFLRSVELQQMAQDEAESILDLDLLARRRINFYEVRLSRNNKPAHLSHWPGGEDDELDANPLQVLVQLDNGGKPFYTLYVDDEEFSSLTLGKELFARVADRIMSFRQDDQRYPCFITDLQLSDDIKSRLPGGRAQTYHYLLYKQRIETQINRYIQQPDASADREQTGAAPEQ